MKTINFHINYETTFGQGLCLHVMARQKKGGDIGHYEFNMHCEGGSTWVYQLTDKVVCMDNILEYYFTLGDGQHTDRKEWTTLLHRAELNNDRAQTLNIYCRWYEMPDDSYRYSSAFTDCINHCEVTTMPRQRCAQTLRITVRAPQLEKHQQLVMTGEGLILGQWNTQRVLPMTQHNYNEWSIDLDAAALEGRKIEFKFAAVSVNDPQFFLYEEGLNRTIDVVSMGNNEIVEYELEQSFFEMHNQRFAGTLVPVFSLRSKGSFGVGDFGDLQRMIDWVHRTGQCVLQILPVNDTTMTHTWQDSYPYNSNSIFALHPQYTDLRQLPELADAKARERFSKLQKELNSLPQIDYERVNDAKADYLRLVYAQEGKATLASAEFKKFFAEEQYWLVPYAQYSLLRDTYGTPDFTKWPGHEQWNEADRRALSNPKDKAFAEVGFYYYVQYQLSRQMTLAHNHARKLGVVLKGDIPIGVSRNSCDVWMDRRLFNLDGQAGAPPDDFSVNGQNWGFPTYNWQAMIGDGCRWWVRRFQNMARYFDAYRIDHVLGFFRIWEIPISSVHGLLGCFSPSLGMSVQEIESYGLQWNEHHMTMPFIADWTLQRIFGVKAALVKAKYLNRVHDDIYAMKPEYDTQRKIETAFKGITDEGELGMRDGLYSLVSDVLFVRDPHDPTLFHPRISAHHDFVYEALWDTDKEAFNRLYDDYFYRRNNNFWYNEAMKKLPRLVEATRMLVCAEDLGMVPDCVDWVMRQLRILSLEIQSMPKDPGVRFGQLNRNPYRSVCTISSHDMPTLRQWWDEDPTRTQDYYNTSLGRNGEAPHPLPGWLARDIVREQLACPSMLCVLSIQDWLSIDEHLRLPDTNAERINIPANPRHYWRYRMHMNIEDLMTSDDLNNNITQLIQGSGRV